MDTAGREELWLGIITGTQTAEIMAADQCVMIIVAGTLVATAGITETMVIMETMVITEIMVAIMEETITMVATIIKVDMIIMAEAEEAVTSIVYYRYH